MTEKNNETHPAAVQQALEASGTIVSLRWLFNENFGIEDFVKGIEGTYRGLGLPVLYGALSILANKSVLFIGGRGVGKTRLINCIPPVNDTLVSKWDTFTYGELDNLCASLLGAGMDCLVGIRDKDLVFKVEEFSTLSEYHRSIFLTVCSKIASDGEFIHVTTLTPHLRISDCKLTMLIAIQPKLYSLLGFRYPQWDNMSYDRFTKFLLLNPLREESTFDIPLVATLPRKIPPSASIPNNIDLRRLVSIFKGHVSEGRSQLYARDYATAIARFKGKDVVQQEDVEEFQRLFSPYLESFSKLQQREDMDAAITVSSGHMELLTCIGRYLQGITKEHLSESLMVSPRHIERCAQFLLEKGLIRDDKEDKKYHLSIELETFFNWYKDTFSVEMSPPIEIIRDTIVNGEVEHPLEQGIQTVHNLVVEGTKCQKEN